MSEDRVDEGEGGSRFGRFLGSWGYLAALLIGGFFAFLGPCMFFTWQDRPATTEFAVRDVASPDGAFAFDVEIWSGGGEERVPETSVLRVRAIDDAAGEGVVVFTAAAGVYAGAEWLGERQLVVRYRFGPDLPRPVVMTADALGVRVRFDVAR